MRLRGQFRDPVTFLRILQSIGKLSQRCLLRFSPEEIHFVISRGKETCEAYAALDDVKAFFREYKVESNFNNQVNIECNVDHLCQALKQTNSASHVTMKLEKKSVQATLNFIVITRSSNAQELTISHDVAVSVQKPKDMENIPTPEEASRSRNRFYTIVSSFPDLAEVRIVASQMKLLDPGKERIIISANRIGELKMAIDGETTKVETIWKGMKVQNEEELDPLIKNRFEEVGMDAKTVVNVLSCPLVDYVAEIWIAPRRFATFLIHVRKQGADGEAFVAHLMITLPAITDSFDD